MVLYRKESMKTWFGKHIWAIKGRRDLLMESEAGDVRWLDAVPHRSYPKWAKEGQRRRQFCHEVTKWAREVMENPVEYDLDNRPKGGPGQEGDGKDEE